MDFKQLFDDDRAVSPVIGVILMVAITVILAAVIGTFVLGLGDQVQNTTPRASFGFDTAGPDGDGDIDYVNITHESGDSIAVSDLKVNVNGTNNDWPGSGDVTAGTQISVYSADEGVSGNGVAASGNALNGGTIRVVYDSADQDSSSTLAKFEVPE